MSRLEQQNIRFHLNAGHDIEIHSWHISAQRGKDSQDSIQQPPAKIHGDVFCGPLPAECLCIEKIRLQILQYGRLDEQGIVFKV